MRSASGSGFTSRTACAVLICVAALPALIVASRSTAYSTASYDTNISDALIFRASAELLSTGKSPYDVGTQSRHIARTRLDEARPPYTLPFAYPPSALPIFGLYLIGPPRAGYLAFVIVGLVAMLATLAAMSRVFGRALPDRYLMVVAAGISGATLFNALLGQTGTYLAAAIFLFVTTYRRAPRLAGIALGLMAFKPQYALPIGLVALIDRKWMTITVSLGVVTVCTIASGLLYGFDLWSDFLHAISQPNHTASYMCNWFSIVNHFDSLSSAALATAGLPVMAIGCLAVVAYCRITCGNRWTLHRIGFAIAISLVASPNTHPYDLIIWIVPACVIGRRWANLPAWIPTAIAGLASTTLIGANLRWVAPLISIALAAGIAMTTRHQAAVHPVKPTLQSV